MNLVRRHRFAPGLLYLSPGLDVVLMLVFFVILSSRFLLQPGIAVQLPFSPFALAPVSNPTVVSLTGAPAAAVYYENEEIVIEDLRERLGNRPVAAGRVVVIKADSSVPYDKVIAVSTVALDLGLSVVLATDER
jgi:biopolymer transport protein ExbD